MTDNDNDNDDFAELTGVYSNNNNNGNGGEENNDSAAVSQWETLETDDGALVMEGAIHMIHHWIKNNSIIDKRELSKKLGVWNASFVISNSAMSGKDIKGVIAMVFDDYDTFDAICDVAASLGRDSIEIRLDDTQHIEIAIYLINRYHIKRMSLDGALLFFDGKCYSFKSKEFLAQQINRHLPFAVEKTVREIFKYVERNAPRVPEDTLEKYSHIKCLENGMYDIISGEFYETFNAEWIVTNKIPHNYIIPSPSIGGGNICNGNIGFAACNNMSIISEIINDKDEMQVFLDFLSICLYPDIGIYMMMVFLGGGGTGKKQLSTFAKLLLGDDNVTNFSIHGIVTDSTNQISAARSMLNIDEDMSEAEIKVITVILKWVTRDPFQGRVIYGLPVKYMPLSRLMCNTNKLFDVDDEEHAEPLYDRTHTVQLKKKFRHSAEDIADIVKKTFTNEDFDRTITALLKNATVLNKTEKIENRHSTEDEANIWNKFGNWLKQFVANRTVKSPDVKVVAHDIWNAWNEWCEDKDISAGTPRRFYKRFEAEAKTEMTHIKVDGETRRGFYSIRLMDSEEIAILEQQNLER